MLNFFRQDAGSIKNDVLSGVTVALALVPEAIAFAFVAGVSPLIGLYSAFFLGLITAILGGRPGMISGATGAMAVVVVALVAQHGIEYLVSDGDPLWSAADCDRYRSLGQTHSHGASLGHARIRQRLGDRDRTGPTGKFQERCRQVGELEFLSGTPLYLMLALVATTMLIIWCCRK